MNSRFFAVFKMQFVHRMRLKYFESHNAATETPRSTELSTSSTNMSVGSHSAKFHSQFSPTNRVSTLHGIWMSSL